MVGEREEGIVIICCWVKDEKEGGERGKRRQGVAREDSEMEMR